MRLAAKQGCSGSVGLLCLVNRLMPRPDLPQLALVTLCTPPEGPSLLTSSQGQPRTGAARRPHDTWT